MLAYFLLILIWIPSLIGWGQLLFPILFPKNKARFINANMGEMGILGIICTACIGLLANFAVPLNHLYSLVIWIIGSIIFVKNVNRQIHLYPVRLWAGCLCALLFICFNANNSQPLYDTGQYHLQSMLWKVNYPQPLGLANLSNRFGTDSIWFTTMATLWLPGAGIQSAMLGNCLLLFFFLSGMFSRMCNVVTHKDTENVLGLFILFLLLFDGGVVAGLGTSSTDLPITMLIFYSIFVLVSYGDRHRDESLQAAILLTVFCYMLKQSSLVYFFIFTLLTLFKKGALLGNKPFLKTRCYAFCTFILLVWFVHNVCLSGCLFFPMEWSCLSLPWTLDWNEVKNYRLAIGGYAISGGSQVKGHSPRFIFWFPKWVKSAFMIRTMQIFIFISFLGMALVSVALIKDWKLFFKQNRLIFPPIIASALAILFWLLNAPDPRFGHAYLLAFPVLVCVSGYRLLVVKSMNIAAKRVVIGLMFLLIVKRVWEHRDGFSIWFKDSTLFSQVKVQTYQTREGVRISVPERGDQCWLSTLPCTPIFDPQLKSSFIFNHPLFYRQGF